MNLQPFAAAVLALTLFKTAQVIEIRARRHRLDPARPDGGGQGHRAHLPVAARLCHRATSRSQRFLPPWINGVTDAVKGSALVSLLGMTDLMHAIQQVIGRTYEPLPLYVLGAFIYFVINYAFRRQPRGSSGAIAYIRD